MAEAKNFIKDFKEGDVIFGEYEPGNVFYLIKKGKVKITKISEKYEKILDILQEGAIFGEMAIIEQAPRSASAIAETDVQMTEFTKDNFKDLLSTHPELLVNLIRILSFRIYEAKRRLSILQLKDNEGKIIDALIMLAENVIRQTPDLKDTKNIVIQSSMASIGSWCGLDENSAKNILFNLEKMGKIETKPGVVIIKDLQELRRTIERKKKMAKAGMIE